MNALKRLDVTDWLYDFEEAVRQATHFCTHRDRDLGDCCPYTRDVQRLAKQMQDEWDLLSTVARAAVEIVHESRQALGLPKGVSLNDTITALAAREAPHA